MTPSLRLLVNDRGRLRHDAQVRYQRAAMAWERRRRTVLRASMVCFAVAIGLAVLLLTA